MTERTVTVTVGLESRPAAMFVQTAGRFASHIDLCLDAKTVNAKSIMGLFALGLLDGQTVTIRAEGADADEAAEALSALLTEPV